MRCSLVALYVSLFAVAGAAQEELAWKVEYDSAGRVANRTDPAGRRTVYSYEQNDKGILKRVSQTPPEGPPVRWTFDASGRLETMVDGEGRVSYSYDNLGRLSRVERAGSDAVAYTHDSLDRITSLQVGDFYRIGYTYDFLGRLSSMETPAGKIGYAYQTASGTVIRTLPNGITSSWTHHPNGELGEICHARAVKGEKGKFEILAQYRYQHGPEGRITGIVEQAGRNEIERRYTYDKMGRLTLATETGGKSYGYTYDAVGNRTKAAVTGREEQNCDYDWAGRLIAVNGKPCAHDGNGNLTRLTLDGVTREYRYHPDGRLAWAKTNGDEARYAYDGNGLLVSRKSKADETIFIPDPLSPYWQPLVIEEKDGERTLMIWEGAHPLARLRGKEVEWMLVDHLGSPRTMANTKGEIMDGVEFGPFGDKKEPDAGKGLSLGFAGLFVDETIGLQITASRAYQPITGSFFQPDPKKRLPSSAGENLGVYTYCENDPVAFVDRDGKQRDDVCTGLQTMRDTSSNIGDNWLNTFSQMESLDHVAGFYDCDLDASQARHSFFWKIAEIPLDRLTGGGFGIARGTMTSSRKILDERYASAGSGVAKTFLKGVEPIERNFGPIRGYGHAKSVAKLDTLLRIADLGYKGFVKPISDNMMHSLSKHGEFAAGQFLNFVGKGSNWIGSQRGGSGWHQLTQTDSKGRLPLGDTTISGIGRFGWQRRHDEAAKWHDIQDYVNTHAPKDQDVKVDYGNGEVRYFVSQGADSTLHNFTVFELAAGFRKDFPMWKSPVTRNPIDLSTLREKDPVAGERRVNAPSPVGGVYLGGAGGAMSGLGSVRGIQMNVNGNLVLVAEDGGDVKLPLLRVDDLVTVFRSVYLNGEGPTVTIDPDPENPEGAAMHIIHSQATADTYVGWVLYQADRLMKTYTLGVDNETKEDVTSKVPGYLAVVDTMYFGAGDRRKQQMAGNWERFWIVPAGANRYEGMRRELTLFDVPLKVKTQKMKWAGGKLVDDLSGASSAGATAFTKWFTTNLDAISAECYLTPPPDAGMDGPVPVFAELRRIALMTALAEKLRDEGVPMPFWMRDHEVRQVVFEKTTPAMEVTRKRVEGNLERTSRILGGVQLSPESKEVKTFVSAGDVAKLPRTERAEVDRSVRLAQGLERAVAAAVPSVAPEPMKVQQVKLDGKTYQATALPGAGTLAPNPCRLDKADLAVPLPGGGLIGLVRSYNSFFQPKGPWGVGWALDLPRLQQQRIPLNRTAKDLSYALVHELITPLNSQSARFGKVKRVPEAGGAELSVPQDPGPFLGLGNTKPVFLENTVTQVIIGKDGSRQHFTTHGDLIAIEEGPNVTYYERGAKGQMSAIIGMVGGRERARIALSYNETGSLSQATASTTPPTTKDSVTYQYDADGQLVGVTSDDGTVGYSYKGPLVVGVNWTPSGKDAETETVSTFEYDRFGHLTGETSGGRTTRHEITPEPDGLLSRTTSHEAAENRDAGAQPAKPVTSSMRYDGKMRPIEQIETDGTRTNWAYQQSGATDMTVTTPTGEKITIADSANGATRTLSTDQGENVELEYDGAGRPVKLAMNGGTVATQRWDADGQLGGVTTPDQAVSLKYGKDALLESCLVVPAASAHDKDAKTSEWQETTFDSSGNPVGIKDASGLDVKNTYDDDGNLVSSLQKAPDGKNLGVRIKRGEEGRLESVDSSWGNVAYAYTSKGDLERMVSKRDGATASVKLDGGLVREVTAFDNGVTKYSYHETGDLAGALSEVECANGLKLRHQYDKDGRLNEVALGDARRVRVGYDQEGRPTSYSIEPVRP